ncbi:MAG: WD40 repeat domain-containing serine/threonine protein kinase [Phycisphaerae bacterium]|nr:WD40 repeat domain-containing serine/threonine protein kinase [Phycisphaerae bacterium]
MGSVWHAQQLDPPREVAVKFLLASSSRRDSDAVGRFRREARLLASIRHPGVAAVYASGLEASETNLEVITPYLVMELVDGGIPVDDFCRAQQLRLSERVLLLAGVYDAVGAAHTRGLVHRDLKPGNVLVDKKGDPKVIDFGVARLSVSDNVDETAATEPGRLIGTMQYMSPEQFGASSDAVDLRSDVYASGLLLHEVLAGRPPYDLGGLSVVQAFRIVCEGAPERLAEASPECRGDLDAIVKKCLAKTANERYASASDIAADLRRHLAHEPVIARRLTAHYQLVTLARRHPVAAVATLLAVCLFLSFLFLLARARTEAINFADRANVQAAAFLLERSDTSRARTFLRSVSPSGRNWTWRALVRESGADSWQIPVGKYIYDAAPVSGGALAYVVACNRLLGFDTSTGDIVCDQLFTGPVPLPPGGYYPEALTVDASDDGRFVATVHVSGNSGGSVSIVRVWDTLDCRFVFTDEVKKGTSTVAIAPDGSQIIIAPYQQPLEQVALNRSSPVSRVSLPFETLHEVGSLDIDPSGEWLAIGTAVGTRILVDLGTGTEAHEQSLAAQPVRRVRWAFDGSACIASCGKSLHVIPRTVPRIHLRLDTPSPVWGFGMNGDLSVIAANDIGDTSFGGVIVRAAISATTEHIAVEREGQVVEVFSLDPDGERQSLMSWTATSPIAALSVHSLADGPVAAAALVDGSITVLNAGSRTAEHHRLSGLNAHRVGDVVPSCVALVHEGRAIAVGTSNNEVVLLDRTTGETSFLRPRQRAAGSLNTESGVTSVAETAFDGQSWIAVASSGKMRMTLWHRRNDAYISAVNDDYAPLRALAVVDRLFVVGDSDGRVSLGVGPETRMTWQRRLLSESVRALALHPTGKFFAAADSRSLIIADSASGDAIAEFVTLNQPPLALQFGRVPERLPERLPKRLVFIDGAGRRRIWNGDPHSPSPLSAMPPVPDEDRSRSHD